MESYGVSRNILILCAKVETKSSRFVNSFQAVARGLGKMADSKEREKTKQNKIPGILPLFAELLLVKGLSQSVNTYILQM